MFYGDFVEPIDEVISQPPVVGRKTYSNFILECLEALLRVLGLLYCKGGGVEAGIGLKMNIYLKTILFTCMH